MLNSFIAIVFPTTLKITIASGCTTNIANTVCNVIDQSNITVAVNGVVNGATVFRITVNSVKNLPEATSSTTVKIYTYYDALYDSLVDQVVTGLTVTMTSNPILIASVTPISLQTYFSTNYQITATLIDQIPMTGFIRITFPSTTTILTPVLVSASFSTTSCTTSNPSSLII
jgi:hypothetical protein